MKIILNKIMRMLFAFFLRTKRSHDVSTVRFYCIVTMIQMNLHRRVKSRSELVECTTTYFCWKMMRSYPMCILQLIRFFSKKFHHLKYLNRRPIISLLSFKCMTNGLFVFVIRYCKLHHQIQVSMLY